MALTPPLPSERREGQLACRVATHAQSQMAENAFDEGHYQLGISALDALCSPGFRLDQ